MTNIVVTNRQDALLAVHTLHFTDRIRKLQSYGSVMTIVFMNMSVRNAVYEIILISDIQ